MIYPDVAPEEWAERHRIEIKTYPCPKCGKEYQLNIPYATKRSRGFIMEDHGCGKGMSFTFVYVDFDINDKLEGIVGKV